MTLTNKLLSLCGLENLLLRLKLVVRTVTSCSGTGILQLRRALSLSERNRSAGMTNQLRSLSIGLITLICTGVNPLPAQQIDGAGIGTVFPGRNKLGAQYYEET